MPHYIKISSTRKKQSISEITMNELREIDSIKLNINDKLVEYLVKEGGVPIKGIPSSFR